MHCARVRRVRRARAVADFAVHTKLAGLYRTVGGDFERAGGMACETPQDSRRWVEDPVSQTLRILVTGGDGEAVRGAVPGLAMFQVIGFVQAADKRDGLVPCAKGPLAGLGFAGVRQRPGVSGIRLRLELRRVASAARCRACILAH